MEVVLNSSVEWVSFDDLKAGQVVTMRADGDDLYHDPHLVVYWGGSSTDLSLVRLPSSSGATVLPRTWERQNGGLDKYPYPEYEFRIHGELDVIV